MLYHIEGRIKSGGEWFDTGKDYAKEKFRDIALAAKNIGPLSPRIEYRAKKDMSCVKDR